MPDPNKSASRVQTRSRRDASKTPKVGAAPKFIGTQKYGREFVCKVDHNQMTNAKQGRRKVKSKADSSGEYSRGVRRHNKSLPTQSEMYKGGMAGHGGKIAIAKNLSRG